MTLYGGRGKSCALSPVSCAVHLLLSFALKHEPLLHDPACTARQFLTACLSQQSLQSEVRPCQVKPTQFAVSSHLAAHALWSSPARWILVMSLPPQSVLVITSNLPSHAFGGVAWESVNNNIIIVGLLTWAAKSYFIVCALWIVFAIFANKTIFRIDRNSLPSWWKISFGGDNSCFNWSGNIDTAYRISRLTITCSRFIVLTVSRIITTHPIGPSTNFTATVPILRWLVYNVKSIH